MICLTHLGPGLFLSPPYTIERMKTKRDDSGAEEEEHLRPDSKLQRVVEDGNSLLPLASYNDDDDEDDEAKRLEQNGTNGAKAEEDESSDDDESHWQEFNQGINRRQVEIRRDCPYLDTVNRQLLDFDFEKFCSVSLSNLNVYACLVCGKYFQGRGQKSHAYTHSLEAGHHVFINLKTEKVYCLPDGYEINDPSLDDIRHVLNPRFQRDQVEQLDKSKQWSRALDGSDYLPGMVLLSFVLIKSYVCLF
uniref:UBP-type domain-containing protein n=1 Tax=Kalanchoe fedtschenkoi TaxID=63787 RepID=A0A7N0VMU5_KALFE